MDCKSARLLLDYYRPNCADLAGEDLTALEQHLACCPECGVRTRGQRQADALLGRAMRNVAPPERLRERLLARLQTERRDSAQRKLGWVVRAVAAAAAVLLIVVGAWYAIWGNQPPELQLAPLAQADRDKYNNPTPEIVAAWYQDHFRGPFAAPPNFDYAYLSHYGFAEIQGRRVPELTFAQGTLWAHVYVVNRDQFKLDGLNKSLPGDLSGASIKVWAENPSVTFIVVYSGNDPDELERLLVPRRVN